MQLTNKGRETMRRALLRGAVILAGFGLALRPATAQQYVTTDTMALALDWTQVASADDLAVEVHPGRLSRDADGMIRGWERTKYKTPRRAKNGKTYVSVMVQTRYDCDARRSMSTRGIHYDRSGGVVISWTVPTYDQEWTEVVPESVGEAVLDEVCAYFGR
jgi:hypothetical protein